MPTLTVQQVSSLVHGKLHDAETRSEIPISSISIDSRTIFDPESSLFFALKTERNDGHRYTADLVHAGVRAFVVSNFQDEFKKYNRCSFVVVPDTLEALQKLAAWNRAQYGIPVVGITGSNGKTIVKEWLFELLQNRVIIRSPKSYNSQVGVPLSVWNLGPEHELAIFEAGVSKPGEMQKLAEIIRPTIGIFTNLGEAHQENFTSKQEKLNEKLKLFQLCTALIYCKDQELVHKTLTGGNFPASVALIAWSFTDPSADLYFRKENTDAGIRILTDFEGENYRIDLPFQDEASIENASHCLAFVLSQHFAEPVVLESFRSLQPVAMRLEMKDGINNCLLINDYYNSDINSLQIALSFLNNHARHPYRQKTVILSDIQQAGIPDEQLYQEVARLIQLNKVERLIGIGPKIGK